MKDLRFPFYAKASLVFIGLFSFISMLYIAQNIILPIIYSVIIAIVLSPAVEFLVRKKLNRLVAITLTMILFILVAVLLILFLSSQLVVFSESFPDLIRKFHELTSQTVRWISDEFNISTRKINLFITEKNKSMLVNAGASMNQTIINTGSVLVVLVLIPVYTFVILYYKSLLLGFVYRLFRLTDKTEVDAILTSTKKIIRSYLVGLLIESVVVAILNCCALLILGIQYAILLGIIGAIVNVIPFVGGLIAMLLPVMIALATQSPTAALLVMLAYLVIQFIDNHYIIPKVVASKVQINALMSIIIVICGGALWGLPGMFLSIPLIAILKVIFDHIEPLKPWGYLLGDTMHVQKDIILPEEKTPVIES